jgi:type I restriction enzyme S subunit
MRGKLDLSEVHRIELFGDELARLRLESGDLLIVEGNGSPSEIGRLGIWDGSIQDCVHQNHIIRARLRRGILPAYVAAYWNSADGARELLNLASSTSGLYTLSVRKVSGFAIPLAPIEEQGRIVAEIESQFTRLDAACAALRRAKSNIGRYRASVLGASCQGCEWVEFGALSTHAGYGTSVKCDYGAPGPPVIRISNVRNGSLCFDDLKNATSTEALSADAALRSGDFLVIRTNGSRTLIGRCALVERPPDAQHYFASYLIRFRLSVEAAHQKWLRLTWDAPRVRAQIESTAATSAGQYNINIPSLRRIAVPLPPQDLASRLADLERQLSLARNIEANIIANLRRAERLRQAILKRAFEGRLVPQDPSDKPADAQIQCAADNGRSNRRIRAAGKGK